MDLTELVGREFGPRPLRVSVDGVADFVSVTGDDRARWEEAAPPGYAAAALFVVAPELLGMLSDRSVIHGEQSFQWHQPIAVGELLDVTGTVSRSRERGGVHYVGFDVSALGEDGPVLEGSSLFIVSGESLPASADYTRPEPPHSYRGDPGPEEVAASRDDLVRYAAATRDWNPVHWDHDAAVAAGLPGVVVHGLFQASWAFTAATARQSGPSPLAGARVRFRSPLLPARPVRVEVSGTEPLDVSISDDDTQYLAARIELNHG